MNNKTGKSVRTLIVGAGDAATYLISQMFKKEFFKLDVIAVVDDDPSKKGEMIHGVPVVGSTEEIPKIVEKEKIDQITVAIPSLKGPDYHRILRACLKTGVFTNKMPSLDEIMSGRIETSHLREIDIEDLLERTPVRFDTEITSKQISGKTVLVTGAGGSIGSEICRQILSFEPGKIVLLGHGENSIYLIDRELRSYGNDVEILPIIADVKDEKRMDDIFSKYKPSYVYHAAAHKHVPLMEISPEEAVKNNVIGTKNVASAALKHNADKFVMISTDKAVNPTSIMGASKRLAEIVVQNFNGIGHTKFVSVRFGNVLGSRGSVVPLFKEQIKNGGPITITDRRMTRYFMTIHEASQLVIQAGFLAEGGEIFVLDMGKPLNILDLARKMIKLNGLTEDDIEIKEVGIRPGEKLYEETLSSKEMISEQIFPKIFVGNSIKVNETIITNFVKNFRNYSDDELKEKIMNIAMIGYEKLEVI